MFYRNQEAEAETEMQRVRLPRGKEVLGVLEQRLGASRMLVKCFDGFRRVCRIPGKLKRKLWLRESDVVLVEPWQYQEKEKGDILFKYSKAAVECLRKHGFIKITEEF